MKQSSGVNLEKLSSIFKFYPQIKLVYFFGSRVKGKSGLLSDYDFAVYLDEKNKKKRFDLRLNLMRSLSHELRTDAVDVVVLNDTESPELKYSIVTEGKLIYQEEPYKVSIEPRIFNEYFDFMYGLRKYGLTKA